MNTNRPCLDELGPIERALPQRALEVIVELGARASLLVELANTHCQLWNAEDRARSANASAETIAETKREIDRLNHRRHQLIDSFDASANKPEPREDCGLSNETIGELCDRLLILDLKLGAGTQSQADATLPPATRQRCIIKTAGLRKWQQHLQTCLVNLVEGVAGGELRLPPRAEFKMYNDPYLNPVRRSEIEPPDPVVAARNRAAQVHERRPRRVLGIGCTGHGASIAYLDDNGVVRASVLDRFVQTKHTLMFAEAEANAIVGKATPLDSMIQELLSDAYGQFPPYRVFETSFDEWLEWLLAGTGVSPGDIDLVVTSNSHFATCEARLGRELNRWLTKADVVLDVEHHAIHQAQAFWASGFDEAAVLTLDTCGESLARLVGRKLSGTISRMTSTGMREPLREFLFPESSVGLIYAVATRHIGFRQGQEGKTMGLAPYGRPQLFESLESRLRLHGDGGFEFLTLDALERAFEAHVPRRSMSKDAPLEDGHADVAYLAQAVVEAVVSNAFAAALRLSGVEDLTYAGGVALNSVANEIARRSAKPRRLYIPPNPSDAGHGLGCALVGAHELAGWRPPAPALVELPEYLGPPYTAAAVEEALARTRHQVHRVADPLDVVARVIANGHIVARFSGQAEYGPRALGNRSILADPRRGDMKDVLNARVKFRESFRPFAPSVLARFASEWFEFEPGDHSPYMLRVVSVHAGQRDKVPAIVHVDGTARVQTVAESDNPGYWRLISRFHELSGVPMLVNTSFNVAGKPIVETPADAVACFEETAIDLLLLEDTILTKAPLDELVGRSR